jgi:carboxymethylenebutenolidase
MSGTILDVMTPDGMMGGYLARPGLTGSGPGVIVIQEIFGVNTVMREVCDWLAGQGFVAFCPDLFWRIEPGLMLTDQSQQEWGRAFELFQAFDIGSGIRDIGHSIEALRAHEAVQGKVGAIGYCLGGKLAYLTAARTDADAAVGYYGVGLGDLMNEARSITKPLMLHIAGKDAFVSVEEQARIHAALDSHANVTLHNYPEDDHAFARPRGNHFNETSAALANRRTLAFLTEHLL